MNLGQIDLISLVIVFGTILLSMTLHEAVHAYVGYWLGDDTARLQGRLTLNPLKHIDPFLTIVLPLMLALAGAPVFGGARPVPFNPANVRYGEWGAALIAIAGPLTNLVLAFLCFGVWVLAGQPQDGPIQQVFVTAVIVNLGFFLFNILPIPPLDGSRVLYALAPEFVRRAMEVIEQFGLIIVFVLVLLGSSLLGSYMITALNFFLDVFSHIFMLDTTVGV